MPGASDKDERPDQYAIVITDQAEAEQDNIHFRLMQTVGPEYAAAWLVGLLRTIAGIAEFPGPFSHPIVMEATGDRPATRRALYHGPQGRRSRNSARYRILFRVYEPIAGDTESMIRILRILHSTQPSVVEEGGSSPAAESGDRPDA